MATDSVSVQSGALFSDGVAAAKGLAVLMAADASGALQARFRPFCPISIRLQGMQMT